MLYAVYPLVEPLPERVVCSQWEECGFGVLGENVLHLCGSDSCQSQCSCRTLTQYCDGCRYRDPLCDLYDWLIICSIDCSLRICAGTPLCLKKGALCEVTPAPII